MKIYRILLVFMLSIVASIPIFAEDRIDSKIRFNDFYGEVKIRPNAEEDDAYEFAELDTVIYEDDRIKTEEDSGAVLGLRDMSTFVIKPESILIIHTEDGNTNKIEMLAGCIWGNIKKMSEGKTFDIEMSQCVAGIKGSTIKFTQSKDGNINIIEAAKGHAEIIDKNGNIFDVFGGQRLVLKAGGETEKSEINPEEIKKDFLVDLESMDDKLDIEQIKEKILEQSKGITDTTHKFETSYNELVSDMEDSVQKESIDGLLSVSKKIENLRLEASRFKGALDELDVTIASAQKKGADNKILGVIIKTATNSKENCLRAIKKIEQLVVTTNLSIEKLNNKQKSEKNTKNEDLEDKDKNKDKDREETKDEEYTAEEIAEKIETVTASIDNITADSKEVIENTVDGSSYADFKNAREACENSLNNLTRLMAELSAIPVNSENSARITALKNYYETTYKNLQERMKQFSSVPEISISVMKSVSDIEKNVPSYASDVRKYLSDYNAVEDKGTVEGKKRYVTSVTNLLANYDKMGRAYTKANRMYTQVQKSFNNSSFKTSEYNEVADAWEKIEQSMTELDNEASELAECVENLKSQLEDLLGQ